MAISFNKQKGGAQKRSVNTFRIQEGENKVRLVGDVLARYVYWVDGMNGKSLPLECLQFNRETEAFDNAEKDWVREYYPDMKPRWSYAMQCIHNGELKVFNLKRGLLDDIMKAAGRLGDPTDIDNGWWVVFEKKKTGDLAFNVEYSFDPFKSQDSTGPLTAEERALIVDLKSMDEIMPRPTPDAQKKLLDEIRDGGSSKDADAEVDDETIEKEFQTEATIS